MGFAVPTDGNTGVSGIYCGISIYLLKAFESENEVPNSSLVTRATSDCFIWKGGTAVAMPKILDCVIYVLFITKSVASNFIL